MTASMTEIHTDGSCLGNPGPGGWAAIVVRDGEETILTGGEASTTNNRMELLAAIEALESLPAPTELRLTSDSRYLRDGITGWIAKWKANGWRTAAKKPVKNQDLWQRLDTAAARHKISWNWVRGHAGHPMNERCDTLARAEAGLRGYH